MNKNRILAVCAVLSLAFAAGTASAQSGDRAKTWDLGLQVFNSGSLDLSGQEPDKQGFRDIGFAGKGGCFPDVTWQLRKVHKL